MTISFILAYNFVSGRSVSIEIIVFEVSDSCWNLKGCDVSALLVDCKVVGVEFSVLVTSKF